MTILHRGILTSAAAALVLAFGNPTGPFADDVVSVTPGPHASGDPIRMTEAPKGLGSFLGSIDVYQPGVGGSVVLHLDSIAKNGAGTDLIVSENPFLVTGSSDPTTTFIEALFVEVSSNGLDYARFPTEYQGPAGPHLGAGGLNIGITSRWFRGFAGVMTVSAGSILGVDPFDVVAGGGDAFDFDELLNEPAVLQGDVQLDNIQYVRLVDVEGGVALDDSGTPVWDCGDPMFACADIDAVCAPNNEWDIGTTGRPTVEMTLVNGYLAIELRDSDGLGDIKTGLTASWDGGPLDFYSILPLFVITELSPVRVVFATGPVPPDFPPSLLKVAARDGLDRVGGDAIHLP